MGITRCYKTTFFTFIHIHYTAVAGHALIQGQKVKGQAHMVTKTVTAHGCDTMAGILYTYTPLSVAIWETCEWPEFSSFNSCYLMYISL